jgi:hypothetical protein
MPQKVQAKQATGTALGRLAGSSFASMEQTALASLPHFKKTAPRLGILCDQTNYLYSFFNKKFRGIIFFHLFKWRQFET